MNGTRAQKQRVISFIEPFFKFSLFDAKRIIFSLDTEEGIRWRSNVQTSIAISPSRFFISIRQSKPNGNKNMEIFVLFFSQHLSEGKKFTSIITIFRNKLLWCGSTTDWLSQTNTKKSYYSYVFKFGLWQFCSSNFFSHLSWINEKGYILKEAFVFMLNA